MEPPFNVNVSINQHYGPIDGELPTVTNLLEGPRQQVKQLDADLREVAQCFSTCIQRTGQIAKLISKCTLILSPIRRIPAAVWGEIFYHCLPTVPDRGSMCYDQHPLILTRVCRSWRQIALETPQLWTSLYIYIPPSLPFGAHSPSSFVDSRPQLVSHFVDARTRQLSEWLLRSGSLPVNITIQWAVQLSNPAFNAADSFGAKILSALLPSVGRWKSLSCNFIPKPLYPLAASAFKMIETLSIDLPLPATYHPAETTLPPSIFSAPRLRDLTFRVKRVTDLSQYPIQWSSLQSLSLHSSGSLGRLAEGEIINILESCVALVTLRLQTSSPAYQDLEMTSVNLTKPHSVTLPCLQTLIIVDEYGTLSVVLAHLRIPRLTNLDIKLSNAYTWPYNDDGRILFRELPLHVGGLLTLTISPDAIGLPSLLNLLKCCPMLKELRLVPSNNSFDWNPHSPLVRFPIIGGQLFALLSGQDTEGEGSLCPHLEELMCQGIADADENELLSFLQAKQSGSNGITPLRRLSIPIEMTGPPDPSVAEQIRSFNIEDKIRINVQYLPEPILLPVKDPTYTNLTYNTQAGLGWFVDHV